MNSGPPQEQEACLITKAFSHPKGTDFACFSHWIPGTGRELGAWQILKHLLRSKFEKQTSSKWSLEKKRLIVDLMEIFFRMPVRRPVQPKLPTACPLLPTSHTAKLQLRKNFKTFAWLNINDKVKVSKMFTKRNNYFPKYNYMAKMIDACTTARPHPHLSH